MEGDYSAFVYLLILGIVIMKVFGIGCGTGTCN